MNTFFLLASVQILHVGLSFLKRNNKKSTSAQTESSDFLDRAEKLLEKREEKKKEKQATDLCYQPVAAAAAGTVAAAADFRSTSGWGLRKTDNSCFSCLGK